MGCGLPVSQGHRDHIIANAGLQQQIREAIGLLLGLSHHQQIRIGITVPMSAGTGAEQEDQAGHAVEPIAAGQRVGHGLAPIGQPALLPRLAQPLQWGKACRHSRTVATAARKA